MFIVRRIIPRSKLFTNFICTSNVLNCDKPEDGIEGKEKILASSEEKTNNSEFITRKRKLKKEKKTYLGISENSVKNVAKEFSGDIKQTTEDIFTYLKEMEISKVEVKEQPPVTDLAYTPPPYMKQKKKFFFTQKPINLTENEIANVEPQVKLKIWDDLEAEKLKFLGRTSPANHFEEMIKWTEEGKLWHFPIDNDQGMEKEAENSFTEHIFMEQYLEPWCPKKGPLRKFMELVLIGLSKNHFYTVEEKIAHIDWFRKYFEEKKKLLQNLGAMGSLKEQKIEAGEEKS